MADDLATLLADLEEEAALKTTQARLDAGEDPMGILDDARRGMETVGERFAGGRYFIPDLVYSAEILRQISDMVKPRLTQDVEVAYNRAEENLARLVVALQTHQPYLRGAPSGLHFKWDVKTIRRGINFTLTTSLGTQISFPAQTRVLHSPFAWALDSAGSRCGKRWIIPM